MCVWALALLYHHHLKLIVSKSKFIFFFSLSWHSFWKALMFPSLAGELNYLGQLSSLLCLITCILFMTRFVGFQGIIPTFLFIIITSLSLNHYAYSLSTTLIFLKHDFVGTTWQCPFIEYLLYARFCVGILFITF